MEAVFVVVPLLMIAFALVGVFAVVNRSRRVSRAWNSGLTAEARCLRTYTTTSGGGDRMVRTTLHHVYEFAARDGRAVRFEETGGPGTILEGDVVTVHYTAEDPEHATARRPAPGRLFAESGCVLLFLGGFIAFCVAFLVTAHLVIGEVDQLMP